MKLGDGAYRTRSTGAVPRDRGARASGTAHTRNRGTLLTQPVFSRSVIFDTSFEDDWVVAIMRFVRSEPSLGKEG